jgi:phytoene desaturase
VRLGARGYRVTVLERLDAPGGRAYVHRQDGFTFDAGPTIVTAPFLFEELWALCGRRLADDVDLRSLDPFYRIRFDDGATFDYSATRRDARAGRALRAGRRRRLRALHARQRGDLPGRLRAARPRPFDSWTDMARIAPTMARLGSLRSVYGMVSRYVRDERLRFALSFHPLFVGGNPFNVTSIYA